MFQKLKNLFGRTNAAPPARPEATANSSAPRLAAVPRVVAVPSMNGEGSGPRVEMVHLSLPAILTRLPDDLRSMVQAMPGAETVVALPLASVQKQLPSGSVKMTFASLQRQSPAGTFSVAARPEDKRMVEVPLAEVFRTLNPQVLRRRDDQRPADLPPSGLQVFGDRSNPYAIAPTEEPEEVEHLVEDGQEEAVMPRFEEAAPSPQRVIRPPSDVFATPAAKQPKAVAKAAPAEMAPRADSLILPLASLAGAWPEPIRSEVLALNGVEVALPPAAVTAGLARGKVTFTWGQLRSWLSPVPETPTQARENTELLLPLKVLAPAFLAHTRPGAAPRKAVEFDETIPALFNGGQAAAPAEPAAIPAPDFVAPLPPPTIAPPPPEPAPLVLAVPPVEAPKAEEPAAPAAAVIPPALRKGPRTLAEAFDQPEKDRWSPPELVSGTVKLPGVAGAIIALQEGLVVAAQLPEPLTPETTAAFLPQMFARMAKYAGEIGLGEVQALTLQVEGALFQTYRFGELYFGVIGKAGSPLPLAELRLVGDQLAKDHTH